MSTKHEDLQAIQGLLNPINDRLDKIEGRMGKIEGRLDKVEGRMDVIEVIQKRTTKKLDDLQLDVKIAERDIRRDIQNLNDEMGTVIEIMKMNELIQDKQYTAINY